MGVRSCVRKERARLLSAVLLIFSPWQVFIMSLSCDIGGNIAARFKVFREDGLMCVEDGGLRGRSSKAWAVMSCYCRHTKISRAVVSAQSCPKHIVWFSS